MGKSDTAVNAWLGDNERFADLFNGVLFEGEQVIRPEELREMDRKNEILFQDKAGGEVEIRRYRDIAKRWEKGMDLAVFACETQSKVHYAMPVRNMLYDSLTYMEQIKALWKQNVPKGERKKRTLTEEEYLSRFRKEDRLCPVITLVFYYDLESWDGPRDLGDMLQSVKLPGGKKSLSRYIPNYHLNLVDAGSMEDENLFHTDLHQVFGMLKYRNRKEELRSYMGRHRDYFGNVDLETYRALRAFLHSEKMLKDVACTEKEVRIDMCQALEDIYSDGIREGKAEGIAEGKAEGIAAVIGNMLRAGLSDADIRRYAGVTDREIQLARGAVTK